MAQHLNHALSMHATPERILEEGTGQSPAFHCPGKHCNIHATLGRQYPTGDLVPHADSPGLLSKIEADLICAPKALRHWQLERPSQANLHAGFESQQCIGNW